MPGSCEQVSSIQYREERTDSAPPCVAPRWGGRTSLGSFVASPGKMNRQSRGNGLDLGNPAVTPVQPVDDRGTLKLNHKYFVKFI